MGHFLSPTETDFVVAENTATTTSLLELYKPNSTTGATLEATKQLPGTNTSIATINFDGSVTVDPSP